VVKARQAEELKKKQMTAQTGEKSKKKSGSGAASEEGEEEKEGESKAASKDLSGEASEEGTSQSKKEALAKKHKKSAKNGKSKQGAGSSDGKTEEGPAPDEKALQAQSLAETAQSVQALVDANNRQWEKKYQDAVAGYEARMSKTEAKYKGELKERNALYEEETLKLHEKHQKELDTTAKRYADLKGVHDKEVKDLFENVGTLKFVKEMRFFKTQWDRQKTVKKRKKIAAAMANATKAWVGDGEKVE